MTERKLIANVTLSIDGFSAGPGGDMGWLVEHSVHDQMTTYFAGVWSGADTVLLGRSNYEGFFGFWPSVAADPNGSGRSHDMALWLDRVEKVVFSTTVTEAAWQNARIAKQGLEDEVRELKASPGRDIIVLSSASVIRSLLKADLVDELRVHLAPEILGDGLRFFGEDVPASSWALDGANTMATGSVSLTYRRKR
ncbi:dihydrofolate reductase family protein [Umezawaea sp. Da 62-37]|uniref:dihydrofolate reductase family protein n=1 Tax=Umezawaea sp. Da 62-37 TaxID=3075927 RepID=UPI0028F6F6C2|nr:dihydrofolate reductase family protein [Umezawaea sp. Da 62-37]WNV86551.1 dihydrofolate reductase family protein [Umezawaea sp. Da 62-37]